MHRLDLRDNLLGARLDWDRWVMMALIGFLVGILGFLLHQFIDILAEKKWDRARDLIQALVGAGCSQFKSSTLNIKLPCFNRFRNSEDRRNFISAGAAAGVTSAFCAPVGGLLFFHGGSVIILEDETFMANFFVVVWLQLSLQKFFNSAFTAFHYQGNFGLFKTEKYILFQVDAAIALNIIALTPTVIVGSNGLSGKS